ISASLTLQGTTLSQGVGADAFEIVSGSMTAHKEPGFGLRDQRALTRFNSQGPSGNLLKTAIQAAASSFSLTTTLSALSLGIGTSQSWNFWFRDLPVSTADSTFQRKPSPAARDINDPDALNSGYVHTSGYEWRLADANSSAGYL